MKLRVLSTILFLAGAAAMIHADRDHDQTTFVATSSNNPKGNQLLAYDAAGALVHTVPTAGLGGVSGNAGGIAAKDHLVAVVNFGSSSVSLFELTDAGFALSEVFGTVSPPVSVVFGKHHLYVLGTANVESHKMFGQEVEPTSDGAVPLIKGDGSAAQVGVLGDQLLITEKSNMVEVVNLQAGAVSGSAVDVPIPPGSLTPFGLVTRGSNGYVTIAHSDEIGLVKNGMLIALTGSGTQHSPCWLALVGQYLFSSNSPSHSISRYVVTGKFVVLDAPIVATTTGAPTDIGSFGNLVAVLDGGAQTHLTQFRVDEDGVLTQVARSLLNNGANGVAVIEKN